MRALVAEGSGFPLSREWRIPVLVAAGVDAVIGLRGGEEEVKKRGRMVATTIISIEVDEAAARAFAEASESERGKLQILLSLRLQELTSRQGRSLQAVMDEISRNAEARGLTPEILETLLRDE